MHAAVLKEEVMELLVRDEGGYYVDGTLGEGGHSRAILQLLNDSGRLLGLDRDARAVAAARESFRGEKRLVLEHGSFGRIGEFAARHGWSGMVQGVLLDLGLCSAQLEDPARGFSFSRDGFPDMRYDTSRGLHAAQWLQKVSQEELRRVLRDYGEEPQASRIAAAIVAERRRTPIESTRRLAEVIRAAQQLRRGGRHPATRSFQAIRIFINQELEELRRGLQQIPALLKRGGRLAVISFHSLEDRIVKTFFRERSGRLPRQPGVEEAPRDLKIVARLIRPGGAEIARNHRARSALLRVAERL